MTKDDRLQLVTYEEEKGKNTVIQNFPKILFSCCTAHVKLNHQNAFFGSDEVIICENSKTLQWDIKFLLAMYNYQIDLVNGFFQLLFDSEFLIPLSELRI